jgi:3D (Asp-Asp-Asp) domain-containing protein
MGNKDNPRRQLRNKIIAGGIGALLLVGGGYAGHTIYEQDKLIHEYQQKLVEQGSLIDQQKKDLVNQKREIETLKGQIDDLGIQLDTKVKAEESYKGEISKLKDELAFKKANEAKAEAVQAMPSRGEPSTGKTVTVSATGYIAMCKEGCTGITATGLNLKDNPHAKVIAVDPDVIPLGTKVFVPGYGYAIAADTGGGIDGWEIDVHFPTTQDARNWGRRTIQIKILN